LGFLFPSQPIPGNLTDIKSWVSSAFLTNFGSITVVGAQEFLLGVGVGCFTGIGFGVGVGVPKGKGGLEVGVGVGVSFRVGVGVGVLVALGVVVGVGVIDVCAGVIPCVGTGEIGLISVPAKVTVQKESTVVEPYINDIPMCVKFRLRSRVVCDGECVHAAMTLLTSALPLSIISPMTDGNGTPQSDSRVAVSRPSESI
jgi:hypothetical protein